MVIMDLSLPKLDGLTATQAIRQIKELCPFLIMPVDSMLSSVLSDVWKERQAPTPLAAFFVWLYYEN